MPQCRHFLFMIVFLGAIFPFSLKRYKMLDLMLHVHVFLQNAGIKCRHFFSKKGYKMLKKMPALMAQGNATYTTYYVDKKKSLSGVHTEMHERFFQKAVFWEKTQKAKNCPILNFQLFRFFHITLYAELVTE